MSVRCEPRTVFILSRYNGRTLSQNINGLTLEHDAPKFGHKCFGSKIGHCIFTTMQQPSMMIYSYQGRSVSLIGLGQEALQLIFDMIDISHLKTSFDEFTWLGNVQVNSCLHLRKTSQTFRFTECISTPEFVCGQTHMVVHPSWDAFLFTSIFGRPLTIGILGLDLDQI